MTKSLMWLVDSMLKDISIRCCTDTHRDMETISRRVKHEGISFLTITLPTFARDFEKSLELGSVDSTYFHGFRKYGLLPAFLRGVTNQVFDHESGKLLDNASEESILCIRQLCLMFKKVNLPCSESRTRKAFDGYVKLEKELSETVPHIADSFRKCADIIVSETFADLDREVQAFELIPRHGPGATAEKISGNQKFNLRRWHTRLEEYFPFDLYGLPSPDAVSWDLSLKQVEFVEPGDEQPVRVISVPKTLSTPRIIAIEPVCNQYVQQAIMTKMVQTIQSRPLTGGHVNFTDQSINRRLAFDSSKSKKFSTIDLSEASDRVRADLVHDVFRTVPHLRDAIFACRSTRASLKDGRTVPLVKFASMGSALCFPVEAMVFYIAIVTACLQKLSLPPTRRNVRLVSRDVFVYGDDLIVPTDAVQSVIDGLHDISLKVNTHKTFYRGNFRESCGMDAYNGVDVTPVYVRSMPPCNRADVSEFVSFVSLANQLYNKGFWQTARHVRKVVESMFGSLPHVQETSQVVGWHNFNSSYDYQRICKELHRPLVKGYVVSSDTCADPLEGAGALLKFFLKVGDEPIMGKHLERSVRPGSASIKYRWALPF